MESLDLKGIAGKLGVNYWRVRRWRKNTLGGVGNRRLPMPDVLQHPPRWSHECIETFGTAEGLWPPASDQWHCSVCDFEGCVYSDEGQIMREHGWVYDPDQDVLVACSGSGQPARARVLAGSAA